MARLIIEVQGEQAERAFESLDRKAKKFGGTVKRLDDTLDKNAAAMQRSQEAAKRLGLAMAAMSAAAVFAFTKFSRASLQTARDFESLERIIKPDSFKFLREEAQRLGLDLRTAAEGFKGLEASAVGTSLEGQKVRDIFTGVSEAATALGLDAQKTSGALLAIEQIISKGTVSAEELRGQLGERLPGAFQAAARSVGVTTAELGKMLQQGQVMAEDFLPKFAAELRRTYAEQLPDAMNSTEASINRANNATLELQKAYGEGLNPAVNELRNAFTRLASNDAVLEFFKNLGKTVGLLFKAVTSLAKAIAGEVARSMQFLANASLKLALAFDKIGLKGAAAGYMALTATMLEVRDMAEGVADGFAGSGSGAGGSVADAATTAGDAVAGMRHEFEETITVLEDAKPDLTLLLDVLQRMSAGAAALDAIDNAIATSTDAIGDGLPDKIAPLVTEAFEDGAEAADFSGLAQNLRFIFIDALAAGIHGAPWQDIAANLAGSIGQAFGAPGIGALVGIGLGAFGDDKAKEAAREQARIMEESQRRMEQLIHATLPSLVVAVETTFEDYRGLILSTGEASEIGALALENLRNSILGISTTLADSLQAAIEFNKQAVALQQAERTNKFGQTFEAPEVALIDLGKLATQLTQQFAGVSFEFLNVIATSEALQEQIQLLGLSELETAQLMAAVAEAEKIRMQQLETDVLQRLVNVLAQIPGMEQASAQLQQQLDQARFQIEVKLIEMQLNAMGLMTEAFQEMLDIAREFGADVRNFRAPKINIPRINIPGGPSFPGGPSGPSGPSGPAGPTDAERLIETLERLASTSAFRTLNDRLRELRMEFFGPDGFAEQARQAGVDMALVNKAFAAQHAALMAEANRGIVQFLGSLQTGSLNPGGISAQFGAAQFNFRDLLARAQAGDLDARSQLGGAGQTFLELARARFGNSRRYRDIFEQVQGSLGDLVGQSFEDQTLSQGAEQIRLLKILAGESGDNVVSFAIEKLRREVQRQTDQQAAQHEAELSAQAKDGAERNKRLSDVAEAVEDAKSFTDITRPAARGKLG